MSTTTTHTATRSPSFWRLNREAWRAFVIEHIEGRAELTASQKRAVFRWVHQGDGTSLFKADELLVHCGLHLDDYFAFCRDRLGGASPYRDGHLPDED